MFQVDTAEERIVAVLRDVIEDTPNTLDDLRKMGHGEPIVQALDSLTRRKTETDVQFIDRVQMNGLATQVKRADLEDNMDMRRLPRLTDKDLERLKCYLDAWEELKTA